MKKHILFLLILVIGIFPRIVNAEEYKVNTLIPIDTKATVKTEKFDYNNFVYNSVSDNNTKSLITFESIKNNTHSKVAVSINLLLFGSNKKNIGLVSYCTDKDLDSSYAGYKLLGEEEKPFSISVLSKYFVEGKNSTDIKYIAVMDENKYCHVGGYSNYKDKTIDEIVNGTNIKDVNSIQKLITYIQENSLLGIIIISLIGLLVLVIIIMIIKGLIKKSKNRPVSYKTQEDNPIEETVDLNYDDNTLEEDTNNNFDVSMGANIPKEDNKVEEEKEEESDLTKFFN